MELKNSKLLQAIGELKVHHHICSIYENRQEQFTVVIPYIQHGLNRKEKCIYVADENTVEEVRYFLRESIPDLADSIENGSLNIIDKTNSYLSQGYFDPDWMMSFLITEAENALMQGFSALRITGEASWALGSDLLLHQLNEYESKVNSVLTDFNVTALCQYNKNLFSSEILKHVIETHPVLIYKEKVCRNYHYIPTEIYLSEDKPDETELMLDRTILMENYVESLKKKNHELEILNRKKDEEVEARKKIETELILAKDNAQKAEKLKDEFFTQISHEIRSPINIMLNYVSLIKEYFPKPLSDEIQYSFNAVDSSARRLIRTIDLILNTAEVNNGLYQCVFQYISLADDVLCQLLKEFQSTAKAKGLEMRFVNEIRYNETVFADSYTVSQIFANLIDNAIKYTHEGSIEIRLFINKENRVAVDVKDTGIGMSEDFVKKLYTPFTQEDTGYTRKFEGNGLGLALVKKYCDLNSAMVKVSSAKGNGTVVTIIF